MSANPYAPPRVEVRDFDVGVPAALASRWRRLGAAVIDTIIMVAAWLLLAFALDASAGIDLFADDDAPWPHWLWQLDVLGSLSWSAVFLAVQGPSLWLRSQTLGKWLVGTRIVDSGGVRASFSRIMLRRELPFLLVSSWGVGMFVPLLDVSLIFRRDRRCLHDHLAGTRVALAR